MSEIEKTENNHFRVLLSGSVISLLGVILLGILNYLIRRRLALTLSMQDFGFLYAAMSISMIFLAYFDLGLGQSAIILMSKSVSKDDYTEANSVYNQTFFIKLILSVFISVCIISTHKFWVNNLFHYDKTLPFILIAAVIVTGTISTIPSAVLSSLKKYFILNLTQLINPLVIFIILLLPVNIYVASIAFLTGGISLFLLTSIIVRHFNFHINIKKIVNLKLMHDIFNLSKWVALSTAGLSTMYYINSVVLTYFKGLQAVALYNVALPIMQIAMSLIVLPGVFLPIVSEMWHKNKTKEISDICKSLTDITMYLLWPTAISIVFLSKYLILLLFSEKFILAGNALIILFIGAVFYSLGSFYIGVLNSGGKAKSVSLTIAIAAVMNIILNLCLVPHWGISGAATATAISYFLIAGYLIISIKTKLNVYVVSFKQLAYCAVVGGLCVSASITLCGKDIKTAIVALIVINAIYLGATFPVLKNYYKSILFCFKLLFKR